MSSDEDKAFGGGAIAGAVVVAILWLFFDGIDDSRHAREINEMRKQAIRLGAAHWETDERGEAVFTWSTVVRPEKDRNEHKQ